MSQFFVESGSAQGFVTGPASAVSGDFASFNGATGTIIQDSGFSSSSFLKVANNLSDVANAATSRTNLGLTAVSTQTVTQFDVLVGGPANTIVSVGPGSAGQILQSNGTANPSYTTATYPATTTVNQLLYSTANNIVGGVTANPNRFLTTTSAGIPQFAQTYITGTWTPSLLINASATGITYTTQVGGYTQIGNVVTFWGVVALSSKGVSVGDINIIGYPVFTGGNGSNQWHTVINTTGWTLASYNNIYAQFNNNTNSSTLIATGQGQSIVFVTNSQITNTFAFIINGSYIVD